MAIVEKKPHQVDKMFAIEMAFLLLFISGCGMPLSRPRPSEAEYIARYLMYFDSSQIEKIDYVYEGAVGGECTAARIQFKGPVKIRALGKFAKEGSYDPAKMKSEQAKREFREQWTFAAGGKLPSWLDFPFDKKMRMISEAQASSADEPSYGWTWCIDDERNVVYFCGVKG
jgi:hypothetical protein